VLRDVSSKNDCDLSESDDMLLGIKKRSDRFCCLKLNAEEEVIDQIHAYVILRKVTSAH